jgi:hypothetical protein
MAAVATELDGCQIYFISADLFQVKNVSCCTLLLYLLIVVISVNTALKTARQNLQEYLAPPQSVMWT